MPQTLKQQLEFRLYELKQAARVFLGFTENLTLLKSINETAGGVVQAIDVVQELLAQDLPDEELIQAITISAAGALLDEIIDADAIGELEDYILSAAETIDDAVVSEFLAEIMDKVEVKYHQLLEKTHAFNAVLKSQAQPSDCCKC